MYSFISEEIISFFPSLSLSFHLSLFFKVDNIKVVSNRLFNVLSFAYNHCSCRQCKLVLTDKILAETVTINILCKRSMFINLTNQIIFLLNILNENKTVISEFKKIYIVMYMILIKNW